MSITTKCRCGKSYLLKDELAGKSFRCKQCGKTVAVPCGLDDLEELDDGEDEEPTPIRRRGKKRRSKEWEQTRAALWDVGKQLPSGVVRGIGMVIGILAYVIGTGCFIYACVIGGAMLTNPLVAQVGFGPVFFFGFMGMMQFLGAKAATGRGLMISREYESTGDGSVLAGIGIIIFGIAFPFIIVWVVHEFVAL